MPKLTPVEREQRRRKRELAEYAREAKEYEDWKRRYDAGLIPPKPLSEQWISWAFTFCVWGAIPVVIMSFLVLFGLPDWIAVAVVGAFGGWVSAWSGPDMSDDWEQIFVVASGLALAGFYWTWVLGN